MAPALSCLAGLRVLVTGGGGYVGAKLVSRLASLGPSRLVVCDLVFSFPLPDCERCQVDVSDRFKMIPLLEGIDLCFHLASYGMSGAAQLDATKVINVNVDGTRHVIDGCKRFGVGALVYVSTYNVVFAGQTIEGGDETLPYLQDHAHTDHYSRTKCLAEQMVLAANDGNALKTLAIRPAAIYGEGETRHLPRIARAINSGLGFFAIGSRDVLCDWVHADNLVQALLLAGASLTENAPAGRGGCQGEPEAAGQAFFINDGAPINNFAFLRQVFAPPGSAASASLFWLRVPSSAMYTFAAAAEVLHRAAGRWLALDPFLTKAEVCKVGYTHYMTTARAERILGYRPVLDPQEGLQRTREFFAPLVRQRPSRVLSGMALATPFAALLLLITSMVLRAR